MRGVEPGLPPAPANTADRGAVDIGRSARLGENERRVEVARDLRVRRFAREIRHDLGNIRLLRGVAEAGIKIRRNREIAKMSPSAADILDMLVDAENLLYDEHRRKRTAMIGHRAIGRNVETARRYFHL